MHISNDIVLKIKKHSQSESNTQTRILFILSFTIPLIIILLSLFLNNYAPFGKRDVISASGESEYYTYYYELYDRVHYSQLFDYNSSFPTNGVNQITATSSTEQDYYLANVAYHLSDPSNFIILLFGRNSIPSILNFLFALKLSLCSLFICIYLKSKEEYILNKKKILERSRHDIIENKRIQFEKKASKSKTFTIGGTTVKTKLGKVLYSFDFLILALSICYSLGQFFFSFGMNPTNTLAIAIFPLVLLGIDKILTHKRWTYFSVFFALELLLNIRVAIIISVFLILYICLNEYTSIKHFLEVILSILKAIITSILLVSPLLFLVSKSIDFKKDINFTFPILNISNNFGAIARQLLTRTTPERVQSLYYSTDLYFGIIFLFTFLLFIFNGNIQLSTRIKKATIFLLLISGATFSTSNYLFNGLHFSANMQINYGFLISFLAVSMAYEAIINIEHIRMVFLNISFIIIILLIVSPLLFHTQYDSINPIIISIEFLCTYYLLSLIHQSNSLNYSLFVITLSIITIFEFASNTTHTFNLLGNSYQTQTHENNRSYKIYETKLHILTTHPGANIVFYDSNESNFDPFLASISGYDYIIADKNARPFSHLNLIDTFDNFDIYENPYSLKEVFFSKDIESFHFDSNSAFDSINDLSKRYMNGEEIYNTSIGGTIAREYHDASKTETITFSASIDGDYYGAFYKFCHLGNGKADTSTSVEQHKTKITPNPFRAATYLSDGIFTLYQSQSDILSNIKFVKDYIAFEAPEDGYLLVNSNKSVTCDSAIENESNAIPFQNPHLFIKVKKGINKIQINNMKMPFYIFILFFIGLFSMIFSHLNHSLFKSKKALKKLASNIGNNRTYFICILINFIIILIAMMVTSTAPFGNHILLTNDGVLQVLPYNIQTLKSVHEGTFFNLLNTNQSLLTPAGSDYIARLLDPFTSLVYLIIPQTGIVLAINIIYLIIFCASPVSFIFYITHRHESKLNKKDYRLIPVTIAYSLSTFAMSYIPYKGFEFTFFLPLILFSLEKAIYDNKRIFYILFLAYFMRNAYYAFMLCEFLSLYFLTMKFDSIKDFMKKTVRFIYSSILAAGVAGVFLVPFFFMTRNSNYSGSDSRRTVSITNFFASYLKILDLEKVGSIPIEITPEAWRVCIYCGLGLLIFFPLYLFTKNQSLSTKIRKITLVLLLFISFNNEFLNWVFHGFHMQSQVPNRFAIFFVFMICICFYDVIIEWEELKTKYFIFTALFAILLCILFGIHTKTYDYSFILTITFLTAYMGGIICILRERKFSKKSCQKYILYVLSVEIIINAIFVLPNKIGTNITRQNSTVDAIEELASRNDNLKDSFTNTELVNSTVYNIAQLTDINTMTSFNNTLSEKNYESIYKWCIKRTTNYVNYQTGSPLADLMLRVRYNIVDNTNDESSSIYPEIDRKNDFSLHENPNHLPLAYSISNYKDVCEWNKTTYSDYPDAFAYQNAFAKTQGIDEIYTPISFERYDSSTQITNTSSTYIQEGEIFNFREVNNNNNQYRNIKIHIADNISGNIYLSNGNNILYLGTADEDNHDFEANLLYFKELEQYVKPDIHLAIYNSNNLDKLYKKLSDNVSTNDSVTINSIKTDFNCSKNETVYISLPYISGLTTYVDDKKVTSSSVAGGIAINLSKGKHQIEIKYDIPGLKLGIGVSIITILLMITYYFFTQKKKINSKKRKN